MVASILRVAGMACVYMVLVVLLRDAGVDLWPRIGYTVLFGVGLSVWHLGTHKEG